MTHYVPLLEINLTQLGLHVMPGGREQGILPDAQRADVASPGCHDMRATLPGVTIATKSVASST
jgi:hypothetical protein